MEELWLVCEGNQDSVDAAVIRSIFPRVLAAESLSSRPVAVVPPPLRVFLRARAEGELRTSLTATTDIRMRQTRRSTTEQMDSCGAGTLSRATSCLPP